MFESTNYTKALEAIRKEKKEKVLNRENEIIGIERTISTNRENGDRYRK